MITLRFFCSNYRTVTESHFIRLLNTSGLLFSLFLSIVLAPNPVIAESKLRLIPNECGDDKLPPLQAVKEIQLVDTANVKELVVTPDGQSLVVHEWLDKLGEKGDRVILVSAQTGQMQRILTELRDRFVSDRSMQMMPDGKSVLLAGGSIFDLSNGKLLTKLVTQPQEPIGKIWLSANGTIVSELRKEGCIAIWREKEKPGSILTLNAPPLHSRFALMPLGETRNVLVLYYPNLAGKGNWRFDLFDTAVQKSTLLAECDEYMQIIPSIDGKLAYLFKPEPNEKEWTSVEVWDLQTMKMLKKVPLAQRITALKLRTTFDGKYLLIHDAVSQAIFIWNIKEAKFTSRIPNEGGGVQAFDLSKDGGWIISINGLWEQGVLLPKTLARYDISKM